MKVTAELEAQDFLEADTEDPTYLKVVACSEVLSLLREQLKKHGKDLGQWPLPEGSSHGEMLLRELLMKRKGEWSLPYPHTELCHCRAVTTHKVDQAILAGAHTPVQVSRLTTASTACGTCRPDVEKIIGFRLKKVA